MRSSYLVYPSASEKIKESGLRERILRAIRKDNFPYLGGATYESDVANAVKTMKEEGYFETFPPEFRKEWQDKLNAVFQKPEKYPWKAYRNSQL